MLINEFVIALCLALGITVIEESTVGLQNYYSLSSLSKVTCGGFGVLWWEIRLACLQLLYCARIVEMISMNVDLVRMSWDIGINFAFVPLMSISYHCQSLLVCIL